MDNQASDSRPLNATQRSGPQSGQATNSRAGSRTSSRMSPQANPLHDNRADVPANAAGGSTAPPTPRDSTKPRKLRVRSWSEKPRQLLTAAIPFTRAQAASRGITRRALDDGRKYQQLDYGVWVEAAPTTRVVAPTWADTEWIERASEAVGSGLHRPECGRLQCHCGTVIWLAGAVECRYTDACGPRRQVPVQVSEECCLPSLRMAAVGELLRPAARHGTAVIHRTCAGADGQATRGAW